MRLEDLEKLLLPGRGFIDIQVYVKPRSREDRIVLEEGDLVFYTVEPPVKGRANASLVRYFSRLLGVSPSRVKVFSGHRGRSKRIRVMDIDPRVVLDRLSRALGGEQGNA